jgi:hypothetical protein
MQAGIKRLKAAKHAQHAEEIEERRRRERAALKLQASFRGMRARLRVSQLKDSQTQGKPCGPWNCACVQRGKLQPWL